MTPGVSTAMTPLSIALVSFLMLALQIAWMRALGHAQGQPLAYVVISLALLGFGAGGSVLTLWKHRIRTALEPLYAPALLLCAASTALLPALASPLLDGLEVDLLGIDRLQGLRLGGLGAVLFLPFFFGATALSIAFTTRPERIGPFYAANLAGSAAGAAGSLVLLHVALPEHVMTGLAPVALLAAFPTRPRPALLAAAALITVLAMVLAPPLPRSPYKDLSQALLLPDAVHRGPLPHPFGRVDLVTSPILRYAPDLSLHYAGDVPAPPHVFVNGEGAGHLLASDDESALILSETPRSLPFALGPVSQVLCLAPGGTPMLHLAASRASRVTAVEPHPRIAALMAPLLDSPDIELHAADPRVFLSRADLPPQDLIVFPERGLFGGPAGLQTLGEDPLFTVEALRAAWARLSPSGWLAFQAWLDAPLRHAPRIIDLAAQTLRAEGIADPAAHVAILRGWGSLSLIAGPAPLSEAQRSRLTAFAAGKGFDVLWPPGSAPPVHQSADDTLSDLIRALLGPGADDARRRYRFDIRAPTDDRPFFNQFLRPGAGDEALAFLSVSERGLVILRGLTGGLAAAVLLLVLAPLLPLRDSLARAPFTLPVFIGLGAGFMFFEIALIQRFTLLWGHPVVSAALVITALMCGMGMGSAAGRNRTATPRRLAGLALALALMQAMLLPVLGRLLPRLLEAPAAIRFGGGGLFLLACAVPMGLPFPMGIRLLARRDPRHIPWACGIDGAVAVMAAPAAALLAYRAGYASLSFVSAAAYLLAALGAGAVRPIAADGC